MTPMDQGLSEMRWEDDDVVVKAASTRPMRPTSGEGPMVVFAREALESVARQVETGFVGMSVEHLEILPPVGRWYAAELVTADDGADELILRGRLLQRVRPSGADPDPWQVLERHRELASRPPDVITIDHVSLEPRNFEKTDFEAAEANAPIPVREDARWSELPPLEWLLTIPVFWGFSRFAGSFCDTLGRETAEALVRWVQDLATRAKDNQRDRIVTLRFVLPDQTVVLGFIPVSASEDIEVEAIPALDSAGAGAVAEIAGAQAAEGVLGDALRTAFLWKGGAWHLAWSVGADDTVRMTNWFLANEPDPSRFLGRPLFPD
jgi:hypothetical protein